MEGFNRSDEERNGGGEVQPHPLEDARASNNVEVQHSTLIGDMYKFGTPLQA